MDKFFSCLFQSEDSDDDDQCALSDKWRYQRSSRRWSRKDLDPQFNENQTGDTVLKSSSSHDSLLAGQNSSSETGDSPVLDSKMHHTNEDMVVKTSIPTFDANGNATIGLSPKGIRRTPSDRMKGAKSFLKRVESLKSKRSKKKNITDISDPVVTDSANMQAKIKHLNCRDITSNSEGRKTPVSQASVNGEIEITSKNPSSDLITSPRKEALTTITTPAKTDSNSNSLDSSVVSHNPVLSITDTSDYSVDTKLNDSSLSSTNGAQGLNLSSPGWQSTCSDTTDSSQETLFLPVEYRLGKTGKFPKLLDDSLFKSDSNIRTRSYSYEDENSGQKIRRGSHDPRREMHRVSIYDNVPIEEDLATAQQELDIILSELFQNINGLNKAINGDDAGWLDFTFSSFCGH